MSDNNRPFLDANALNSTIQAVRDRPELGKVSFNMTSASKGAVPKWGMEITNGLLPRCT